jgi:hypothetical protein
VAEHFAFLENYFMFHKIYVLRRVFEFFRVLSTDIGITQRVRNLRGQWGGAAAPPIALKSTLETQYRFRPRKNLPHGEF